MRHLDLLNVRRKIDRTFWRCKCSSFGSLAVADDCRFSTFSWRTRLALHHKGLAFVLHPVAVSDKAAIAFSGQAKVPILKHDDHVVTDSWAIAVLS